MDVELNNNLQKCISLCEELQQQVTQEKDEFHQYLGGEILKMYVESSEKAEKLINKIKNQIINLQIN